MSFLDRFERRFRKYSVSNITKIVVAGMIFFYAISFINPELIQFINYNPAKILKGEIWRLITFIFIPGSRNIILLFFEVMFFYWVGTGLELRWGSFKFTLYYLGGFLGAVIATLLVAVFGTLDTFLASFSVSAFFSMNLFLAFAWYYGNEEIRFMMILPVKVKYLAILDLLMILYALYNAGSWEARIIMLASMLNLIVFYASVLTKRAKNKKRYYNFKIKVHKADRIQKKTARHRCAVCGITEKIDPDMQFRFCSKCEGDYEFCENHLRNHEHIKKIVDFKKPGDD